MRKRVLSTLALAAIAAATAVLTPGVAQAAPAVHPVSPTSDSSKSSSPLPSNRFLRQGPGYVVVNPATSQSVDGGTFYPTGQLPANTMVMIPGPDGQLPMSNAALTAVMALRVKTHYSVAYSVSPSGITALNGPSAGKLVEKSATYTPDGAARPATGPSPQNYAANSAGYSGWYKGSVAVLGSPGYKQSYGFDVNLETSQVNVANGDGFYTGYNGSVYGTYAKAYGLGHASGDDYTWSSVPWGNEGAYPQFQARCAATTLCGGEWQQ